MTRHPYKHLEHLPEWKVLSKAISKLAANGDLKELTARPYIVGYLVKLLLELSSHAEAPNGQGRQRANGHRLLAKDLRSHREKSGLSAKDYGELIGVSAPTVYHWEAGKAKPRGRNLAAISKVLESDLAQRTKPRNGHL